MLSTCRSDGRLLSPGRGLTVTPKQVEIKLYVYIFGFLKTNFFKKKPYNYIWTIFGDSYLGWQGAPRLQAQPAVLGSFGQVSFNSTIGHHLSAFVRQRQIQGLRQRQLQIQRRKYFASLFKLINFH